MRNLDHGQGQTILIVEDNAPLRAALRETLIGLGYRVREAAHGADALELLETLDDVEVNLVLSDVVMPQMGGVALVHALRERGWAMPVILLSGHPRREDLSALTAYGVREWLSKPPSLEHLAQALAAALQSETS